LRVDLVKLSVATADDPQIPELKCGKLRTERRNVKFTIRQAYGDTAMLLSRRRANRELSRGIMWTRKLPKREIMTSKLFFVVLIPVLLTVVLARGQSPEKATSPERYKLVPAQVLAELGAGDPLVPTPTVFLLDTQSGEVWMYVPAMTLKRPDGHQTSMPVQLFPVPRATVPAGQK
jgi:hypothetical protein